MKPDRSDQHLSEAARRLLFRGGEEPKSPVGAVGRHVRVKVTMNVDGDLIEYFKTRSREEGRPYQLLMNDALREYVQGTKPERLAAEVGERLLNDPAFIDDLKSKLR
ncbi:MAG: BrnA antitoxin family protein [Deltaproteobacteria bacterium]|jgi:uncharacterized protein (DUF4415 family)|nr:BrnA antitoxin family protein [Deltaproteobacteria bacterium]